MTTDNLDEKSRELQKKIEKTDLTSAVEVLIKDAHKRKRQIVLLFISISFDILLSIALAFGWSQNHKIALQAETNHDSIVRSCETSNEARSKNKQLWTYILSLPSSETPTPEQQKRVNDFKMFVDDTFAPRDCNQIK